MPTLPDVVLIADNDSAVNALLAEVLRDGGLTCESVVDGVAALDRVRRGGVAVLVTDLDMPGLDGRQLLEQLATLAPRPDAVVISGYLDAVVEADLRADPSVRHVLHKPFDVLEFSGLVRSVVDARHEAGEEGPATPAPALGKPAAGAP